MGIIKILPNAEFVQDLVNTNCNSCCFRLCRCSNPHDDMIFMPRQGSLGSNFIHKEFWPKSSIFISEFPLRISMNIPGSWNVQAVLVVTKSNGARDPARR